MCGFKARVYVWRNDIHVNESNTNMQPITIQFSVRVALRKDGQVEKII